MWYIGTWFSGGLTVGLKDITCHFNLKDSITLCACAMHRKMRKITGLKHLQFILPELHISQLLSGCHKLPEPLQCLPQKTIIMIQVQSDVYYGIWKWKQDATGFTGEIFSLKSQHCATFCSSLWKLAESQKRGEKSGEQNFSKSSESSHS